MCGRFTQYEPRSHYIDVLSPDREFAGGIDDIPIGRYNVGPEPRVLIINQRDDKSFSILLDGGISPPGQKNQSDHR